MKRILDVFIALLVLFIFLPFGLIIAFFIVIESKGGVFYVQQRIGLFGKPFGLLKFRSMRPNSDQLGQLTVGVSDPRVTAMGFFVRKYKLDEFPQFINVLKGDMSFVGPRPNLFNQTELIEERSKRGVYAIRPGITGLAQINKIDMSTPQLLAEIDAQMIVRFNAWNYYKYIFLTVFGKGFGDRVKID